MHEEVILNTKMKIRQVQQLDIFSCQLCQLQQLAISALVTMTISHWTMLYLSIHHTNRIWAFPSVQKSRAKHSMPNTGRSSSKARSFASSPDELGGSFFIGVHVPRPYESGFGPFVKQMFKKQDRQTKKDGQKFDFSCKMD